MNPRFDEKEFSIIKGQAIAQAKEAEANPDEYLKNKALQNAFASRNYSKIPTGTVQSLEKLSLQQVVDHYNLILGKQNCFLVVVGNVTEADLKQKISQAFAMLKPGKIAAPEQRFELKPAANIENRDIATNYIRGTMNAPAANEKDGIPMILAMSILGDRFFLELRTKRSLSYAPAAFYATSAMKNPYSGFLYLDNRSKAKSPGYDRGNQQG